MNVYQFKPKPKPKPQPSRKAPVAQNAFLPFGLVLAAAVVLTALGLGQGPATGLAACAVVAIGAFLAGGGFRPR